LSDFAAEHHTLGHRCGRFSRKMMKRIKEFHNKNFGVLDANMEIIL